MKVDNSAPLPFLFCLPNAFPGHERHVVIVLSVIFTGRTGSSQTACVRAELANIDFSHGVAAGLDRRNL